MPGIYRCDGLILGLSAIGSEFQEHVNIGILLHVLVTFVFINPGLRRTIGIVPGIQHFQDSFKMTVYTQRMNPYLAACITSQHGPVMDQGNFQTLFGCCNGSGTSSDSSSHNYKVEIQGLLRDLSAVG